MQIYWNKIKESFYIRKELKPHRIGLVNQHGRRFIVFEDQYGCHDVMGIRSIQDWRIKKKEKET